MSEINIRDNIIQNIHLLPDVEGIILKNNGIRRVPSELLKRTNLKRLVITNNNIQVIDIRIRNDTLTNLNIDNNQITILHGIELLTGLNVLNARRNHISRINFLTDSILYMDISGNRLTSRQEYLQENHTLQVLRIGGCELSTLRGVDELIGLQLLDAPDNLLTDMNEIAELINHGYLSRSNLSNNNN